MMGLILCGIMQGLTSLRALEKLARFDLDCMWVRGGIYPDHANIGRSINMHETSLTGEFFDALTRSVLQKTNSGGRCLEGNGTTIEAACSNYNLIKEELPKQQLKKPENNQIRLRKTERNKHALNKRPLSWIPCLSKSKNGRVGVEKRKRQKLARQSRKLLFKR